MGSWHAAEPGQRLTFETVIELADWRQFPPVSKAIAFLAPVGEPHTLLGIGENENSDGYQSGESSFLRQYCPVTLLALSTRESR